MVPGLDCCDKEWPSLSEVGPTDSTRPQIGLSISCAPGWAMLPTFVDKWVGIRLIVGFQPLMVISSTTSWIRWCMQVCAW